MNIFLLLINELINLHYKNINIFVNGIFPHKIQNMLDLQDLYKQIKW